MSLATILEKESVRKMIFPVSVEQYHRMNELGMITPKTELIEGIIVEKMTKSPLQLVVFNDIVQNMVPLLH